MNTHQLEELKENLGIATLASTFIIFFLMYMLHIDVRDISGFSFGCCYSSMIIGLTLGLFAARK